MHAHLLVCSCQAFAHHLSFQGSPLLWGDGLVKVLGQPRLTLLVHQQHKLYHGAALR